MEAFSSVFGHFGGGEKKVCLFCNHFQAHTTITEMNALLTNALSDLTQPSATTTLDVAAKKLQVDADYR